MKIYISGKISGLPIKTAVENFAKAEKFFREKGYEVFNPLANVDLSKTYEEHMRTDLRALLDCDAIFAMRNAGRSEGARLEYQVARKCGIRAIFEGFVWEDLGLRIPVLTSL